ncbi:MAG: hypothetical protein EBZ50_03950 [Alphaproteobacteria bacterium]|nr:hypothetical protein [Alphaproteobacteria bacterium]
MKSIGLFMTTSVAQEGGIAQRTGRAARARSSSTLSGHKGFAFGPPIRTGGGKSGFDRCQRDSVATETFSLSASCCLVSIVDMCGNPLIDKDEDKPVSGGGDWHARQNGAGTTEVETHHGAKRRAPPVCRW